MLSANSFISPFCVIFVSFQCERRDLGPNQNLPIRLVFDHPSFWSVNLTFSMRGVCVLVSSPICHPVFIFCFFFSWALNLIEQPFDHIITSAEIQIPAEILPPDRIAWHLIVVIDQRDGIPPPYLGGFDLGEPVGGSKPLSGIDGSYSQSKNAPVD
jgi:hypothetical protein